MNNNRYTNYYEHKLISSYYNVLLLRRGLERGTDNKLILFSSEYLVNIFKDVNVV